MITEEINEQGGVVKFNRELYGKYLKARGVDPKNRNYQIHHHLVGKRFFDVVNQKEVTFEKALKHWWMGYYIAILYVDDNGSHGLCFFENINSVSSTVKEDCERSLTRFIPV